MRILTVDFPHYFAVVSRIRQEVHAVGQEGGTVSSSAVPQVQAIFPAAALTKKIRVGLQVFFLDTSQTSRHTLTVFNLPAKFHIRLIQYQLSLWQNFWVTELRFHQL